MARRIDNTALRAINTTMTRRGISQRDLAEETLIPLSTLHRRLVGASPLTIDEFISICMALDINAGRLMQALAAEQRTAMGQAS
ncbi:helix-turn-helix domain-containing protein [Demequina flava]|uniref:helix-turn-helix domain-containing protein n=1 Tax=Demequina flava TaxID=1095025 RepID=UPI000782D806|nr:helix-turn-helix transcriptional regulator [Demequina flava]